MNSGGYDNTSEYLRDHQTQAIRHLQRLIANGIESGEGRAATDDVISELRDRALPPDR